MKRAIHVNGWVECIEHDFKQHMQLIFFRLGIKVVHILHYNGFLVLTFMKTSISGSGLMFACFSLLDSSANISVNAQNNHAFKNQKTCKLFQKKINVAPKKKLKGVWKSIKLTITGSNPLASCRKGQSFPHSHFSYVKIMLTDIGSCSLGHKLIHVMPIVSHSPRTLQENFTFKLEIKTKDRT